MAESVFMISGFPDFSVRDFDIEKYNQQFTDKNSIISATSTNIYYEKHWGPLSVKFVLSGEEYYHTDNSKYLVNTSNFLILNNNTEYSSFIDADEVVQSFTLNFCENYLSVALAGMLSKSSTLLDDDTLSMTADLRFIEKTYQKEKAVSSIVSKMWSLTGSFEENTAAIEELFNELLYTMLVLNAKVQNEIEDIKALKPSTREELYKRLNYARDYIECCFDQDIDLSKMASVACLNREYFIRQFKLCFGITPTQYLIKRRMEAARRLIRSTDYPISIICRKVGYSDLTSFGKLFRKYHAISPEKFRSNSDSFTFFSTAF